MEEDKLTLSSSMIAFTVPRALDATRLRERADSKQVADSNRSRLRRIGALHRAFIAHGNRTVALGHFLQPPLAWHLWLRSDRLRGHHLVDGQQLHRASHPHEQYHATYRCSRGVLGLDRRLEHRGPRAGHQLSETTTKTILNVERKTLGRLNSIVCLGRRTGISTAVVIERFVAGADGCVAIVCCWDDI